MTILMLSAAHPADDTRIVWKEGGALAAAGHHVVHLAPGCGVPATLCGVELRGHGPGRRGLLGRLHGIPALARAAAALRPAVIHAHEPDSWAAAHLAAWRCGARVVLDVHEHYPSRLDGRLPRWLRPAGRMAVALACRLLAWRAAAVVVAKDGVDAPFGAARCVRVRNYAADPGVVPREHQPGPLRLLHLGAIGAGRGAFVMLQAMARLPEDTQLTLVGRFTDDSEPRFAALSRLLGLEPRVDRHGWLPREQAMAEAARCDVALVLFQPGAENHRLALPHKLFDAMLCGLPVVVPAAAEEVARIVAETGCGIAVDTADPAAVAAALEALHDPARRALMGARGRAAALTRYGWAGEAARLVELYRAVLAERHAPRLSGSPVPSRGVTPMACSTHDAAGG